jgi:hypothetical protein
MHEDRPRLTRRRLLQLGIALPLPALLAACDGATSFPGEAANAADGIFREELLLAMSGDRQASFTFVLSV